MIDGTEIDGHGKVVSVPNPYINANGVVNGSGSSSYSVFSTESNANVTLKNMTVIGGSEAGIRVSSSAFLLAENVNVTRCQRGVEISSAKAIMKNCNIVRNVNSYGGGMLLSSGSTMVMDGCSLSENRSTSTGGGGGAIEVNSSSKLYANNTIIANNCSSEIGGAINNYWGTIYLMNCTLSGNVTKQSGEASYGGGIGNNGGTVYAVNSVIMDNYYENSDTHEMERSDIGFFSGNNVTLVNSIYGALTSDGGTQANCIIATGDDAEKVFTSYRTDGVLSLESDKTSDFKHGVLVKKSGNSMSLYAPLGSLCSTGGTDTYMEYASDLSSVKMGYKSGDEIVGLGNLEAPEATSIVSTYYEETERLAGTIGASATQVATYYTVTLVGNPKHISIEGATVYGDSYQKGSDVTIKGVVDDGYELTCWQNGKGGATLSTESTFTITLDADVEVYPLVRRAGCQTVTVVGDEQISKVYNGEEELDEYGYPEGTVLSISAVGISGYDVVGWEDKDGNILSETDVLELTVGTEDLVVRPIVEAEDMVLFENNHGVKAEKTGSSSYEWKRYTGNEGICYISNNKGVEYSQAYSAFTFSPLEGTEKYRIKLSYAVSCSDYSELMIGITDGDGNLLELVADVSGENEGSFVSEEYSDEVILKAYYYNYFNDDKLDNCAYIYNIDVDNGEGDGMLTGVERISATAPAAVMTIENSRVVIKVAGRTFGTDGRLIK